MKKKTKIKQIFLNNWALKLFSLAAAFLLWLLVIVVEDPEAEKSFYDIPVRLVNTDVLEDNGMVYEILDRTDTVRSVTVTAPKTVRDELISGDIVAEADFSKLTAANTVEIRFYSMRYNDRISNISGSNEILKLNIEEKKTKRLTLELTTTGTVEEGYIVNNLSADQNRVEVSGPASIISRVASASATVDVADSNSSISTYANVVLYDAEGEIIENNNLSISVKSVLVHVDILASKTVPVYYSTTGTPASGYLFTGVVTGDPEQVLIAGDPDVLSGIRAIVVPGEELNITGSTEDLIKNIDIKEYLPEGVLLAEEGFNGRITVTVSIEPEFTRELRIPADHIRITDVPSGYTVELEDGNTSYTLSVRGLEESVSRLDANALYAYIRMNIFMEDRNIEELEPGIYPVEVAFVQGDDMVYVQTLRVNIVISKLEEE
ncbi:MAG: hypothetical protein J1E83_06545 [Lachnospiraceae bacterium]|nr:hypothetical protein [Lachnospiraceae bacterium]